MAIVSTGVPRLDGFFGGVIPPGIIVDVYGSSGAGKTQLAVQTAVHTASSGGRILFQDTTGKFRPERMLEIASENGMERDLLDRVMVSRITNVSEQTGSLDGIDPSDFSLVVVDNVSDLFSFEYPGRERIAERNRLFLGYMRGLAVLAAGGGGGGGGSSSNGGGRVTVMLTNVMRNVDGRQVENFAAAVGMFAHARVGMEGSGSRRRCVCSTAFGGTEFSFGMEGSGII